MTDARARVLIVEDEIFLVMLIEDMLAELGLDVAGIASRVAAALPLVSALDFDLAILDVNLAGEMSFPVADAIAAKGVPYFFATSYSRQSIAPEHAHRPMISKPFSVEDLKGAIDASLGGRTTER